MKYLQMQSIAFLFLVASAANAGSWNHQTVLPRNESVVVLNSRANNPSSSQSARASAVFSLFANHIRPGSSASDVHKVLTDTSWLKSAHISGVRKLGGWIPIELTDTDTIFCIDFYPSDPNTQKSPWEIYFRLSGKLKDEDGVAFLSGSLPDSTVRLIEFSLLFPHSISFPNPVGRIEKFTRKGVEVLE